MAERSRRAGRARYKQLARRWLPWLVGCAILVAVVARVPFASLTGAIGRGDHIWVAAVIAISTIVQLFTDAIASWVALIVLRMRRPFANVIAVRGATYLLIVLNYVISQGGFGYYLHRSGEPALRATGATLFLIGTNFAVLLVTTAAVWLAAGDPLPAVSLGWPLAISGAGFAAYLVVIASAPQWLARREMLAPLFGAGLRGHGAALAARLPHVVAIVISTWLSTVVWGIPVPFLAGMTLVPIFLIASALPISPTGLGTSQLAMVYLFADYARDATADDRIATVLAYSIVNFTYSMIASLVVGAICAAIARRLEASVHSE